MKTSNFIESYENISIVYRHEIFAAWLSELYKLADHCAAATVRDQKTTPGTCCPCIIFEAGDTRAVAYLHSDTARPAMYLNNEYMSIDYRDMLTVLYGYFADVTAPDFADLPPVDFAAVSVIDGPTPINAEAIADLLAAGEPVKARADLAGYLYEIGPHVLNESQAEAVAAPAGTLARAARVFLLALTLTAAPAAADTTDEPQAADVAELLTPDPLAEVAALQAAGLTVSHVTIKSAPAC